MNVRRGVRVVSVLVLALGVIGWQAGIGSAGPSDPPVDETTTTVQAPEAPVTPAEEGVAALAGPVGYTNGIQFGKGTPTDCNFFQVDLLTGVMTKISTTVVRCADGYTFAPDGTLYAYRIPTSVDTKPGPAALVKVDTATGAQVVVGDLPVMFNGGMTFDAAGNLWLYSFNPTDPSTSGCSKNFCLWKVNPANADATLVGGQDTRFVGGLAATCTEVQAGTQVATGPAPISRLDRVDTATADLFKIVDLKGVGGTTGLDVNQTSGLDYDATGVLWGVGLSALPGRTPLLLSAVFRVDPATGVTATATLTLDNSDFLGQVFGLAVAGLACAAPAAVELQPLFTG